MVLKKKSNISLKGIEKAKTGIKGFDEITLGGIPYGRPTLICGNAGCGKTLMAMEIIIRGAVEFNEPGVFFAFEETKEDLIKNVASLGFDLKKLEREKKVLVEYIAVDTRGYTDTGDYDLEGLFIRIDCAIKKINAKRVAFDTLEVMFAGFKNQAILRGELIRLFHWLKSRNLTTVVTAEQEVEDKLTRYGIEEYVADCVVSLTHSVLEELYTRRLQIIKYRGSYHETNLFPFLITQKGISILPITSLEMTSEVSSKRVSTGIADLDKLIGGKGYYQGGSILVSGSSGSGKTTLAGEFARSVSKKKQRCLFFSYEESEGEIIRNMSEVGIEFDKNIRIVSSRPTQWGLEKHLGQFIEHIEEFKPQAVIIDPISTLSHCGSEAQIYAILTRMMDYVKNKNITLLMTILYFKDRGQEFTYGISSIIDTWILLRNEEIDGALKRELLVIKSRGMNHSNRVIEFDLNDEGFIFINQQAKQRHKEIGNL